MTTEEQKYHLRKSLKHWKGIRSGNNLNFGASNCKLCDAYNTDMNHCDGCPIFERTGMKDCCGSAWMVLAQHTAMEHSMDSDWPVIEHIFGPGTVKHCKTCRKLVDDVIDLIKEMLEEA